MAAYAGKLVFALNGTVNAAKLVGAVTVSVALAVVPSVTAPGETLQPANGAEPFTVQVKFT